MVRGALDARWCGAVDSWWHIHVFLGLVKNFEMNRVIFGTIVKRVLWLVNDIISRLVPLIRWMGIILQLLNVVIGHSPSISIS